jgi:Rad3-related DNA helicase
MVVFFTSYKFLNTVKESWKRTGMLTKFARKKQVCGVQYSQIIQQFLYIYLAQVFFEPESSSDVEVVLQKYAEAVQDVVSLISSRKNQSNNSSRVKLVELCCLL